MRSIIVATLVSLVVASTTPALAQSSAEVEVQAAVDSLWEAARNRDLEGSFGPSLPNERGFYGLDGAIVWTTEEAIEMYRELFGLAAKNDIDMQDERITILSEDTALYVGFGTFDMANADGASMGKGDMALTLVMQKVEGDWRLLHIHQSFPASK